MHTTIDPNAFTGQALAWITALGTIAGALVTLWFAITAKIESAKNSTQVQANTARLDRQGAKVDTIIANAVPASPIVIPVIPSTGEPIGSESTQA